MINNLITENEEKHMLKYEGGVISEEEMITSKNINE